MFPFNATNSRRTFKYLSSCFFRTRAIVSIHVAPDRAHRTQFFFVRALNDTHAHTANEQRRGWKIARKVRPISRQVNTDTKELIQRENICLFQGFLSASTYDASATMCASSQHVLFSVHLHIECVAFIVLNFVWVAAFCPCAPFRLLRHCTDQMQGERSVSLLC